MSEIEHGVCWAAGCYEPSAKVCVMKIELPMKVSWLGPKVLCQRHADMNDALPDSSGK